MMPDWLLKSKAIWAGNRHHTDKAIRDESAANEKADPATGRDIPTETHWSRRFEYPWAVEAGNISQEDKCLDAGGASSAFQYLLSKRSARVTLVDLDEGYLERHAKHLKKLREHKNIDLVKGNLCKLPFADNVFDKVFCISVLEHILHWEQAANELVRVLAINGKMVISLDVMFSKAGRSYDGGSNLDARDLDHLAEILNIDIPSHHTNDYFAIVGGRQVKVICLEIEKTKPDQQGAIETPVGSLVLDDSPHCDSIRQNRCWQPREADWISKFVRPGDVVLDVGAYIGYYTKLFSELTGPSGSVVAFEPVKGNFELLKRNIEGNSNVVAFNYAVGEKSEDSIIYENPASPACSSMKQRKGWRPAKVKAVKLDDFILPKFSSVDVVKIDVEGWEFNAIKGMEDLIRRSDYMLLIAKVCHDLLLRCQTDPNEYMGFLESLGFKLHSIVNGQLRNVSKTDLLTDGYLDSDLISDVFCTRSRYRNEVPAR